MDISKLNQYKEDGWLMNQFHPDLPLIIWNYTPKTQYEGFWDEITLSARGLVTDTEGNVISRGFPKFFNIEENRHEPTDDFEILEKLDGQYIGVFWFDGEMIVNSRGSFTSPYAIEAIRLLNERYVKEIRYMKNISSWNVQTTFCFELIGFEQIVVSYPRPDLVLTGIFFADKELSPNEFIHQFGKTLKSAKTFSGLDYKNIKQLNWQNSEGFVVRFSNGQRCKIKFEDYVKLHRQMTNLSTTSIWEALMNGEPVSSILNDVPDEFYDKVHEYENDLNRRYKIHEKSTAAKFDLMMMAMGLDFSRKKFAEMVNTLKDKSILFAMLDGKDYSKMIWKLLKPEFEKI